MEEKREDRLLISSRERLLIPSGSLPLLLSQKADEGAEDFKDTLFSKAFLVVPGAKYNRISYEMRGEGAQRLFFYEIVIPENQGWEDFHRKVYPSLARFLQAKTRNPLSPPGIVISLFHESYFYMIEAEEFMRAYQEIEGIDGNAFQSLIHRWLAA